MQSLDAIREGLKSEGVHPVVLASHMGMVKADEGGEVMVGGTLGGNPSLLFDAVIVPEGNQSVRTLLKDGNAVYHLRQAFKHLKVIGLPGHAGKMLAVAGLPGDAQDPGLLLAPDSMKLMKPFLQAMKQHRIWEREDDTGSIGA